MRRVTEPMRRRGAPVTARLGSAVLSAVKPPDPLFAAVWWLTVSGSPLGSAAHGVTQSGRKRIVNTAETQQKQRQQQNEDANQPNVPEPTEEHREMAKRMAEVYDEDRPTVTCPGAGDTLWGTAINDWRDDGNAVDQRDD